MIACSRPDDAADVALRLSEFLGCQAQALGQNGYQALAESPAVAVLTTSLLTVFVALIGYRLVLGEKPSTRDAVTWAVRIGVVLALATGWPAFRAVVGRPAVDGPGEIAAILLPAIGLPAHDLDARIAKDYDAIRRGTWFDAPPSSPPLPDARQGASADGSASAPGAPFAQAGQPQTASAFVVATLGTTGALRLAGGFLLAIGPLAVTMLLFDATRGLFVGWIRALAGTGLGLLATRIVTALHVLQIEDELAHLRIVGRDSPDSDPQALTTIVIAYALISLVTLWAAARMANGFHPFRSRDRTRQADDARHALRGDERAGVYDRVAGRSAAVSADAILPGRAQGVANALANAVRRERIVSGMAEGGTAAAADRGRTTHVVSVETRQAMPDARASLGRRSIGRNTRSALRRDGAA